MSDDVRIDRRRFTRQLAVGSVGLTSVAAAQAASGAEIPPAPKLPESPTEKPDGASGPESPPPEVLLLTYLVRNYPSDRFDDTAVQGIFRDIRGDVARGKVLTEFPLKNSDEPAFVFRPYRSSDGHPRDH